MSRTQERIDPDASATLDQIRLMRKHNIEGLRLGITFGEASALITAFKATQPPTDEQLELAAKLELEVRDGLLSTELRQLIKIELNRRARVEMAKPNTFIRVGAIVEYKSKGQGRGQDYTIEKIFTKYGEINVTLVPLPGRQRGKTYRRTDIVAGYLTLGDTREIGTDAS